MVTNELQVPLSCDCGRAVIARAKDAGGTISCQCGIAVTVPHLSRLRALAGGDAYITNPVEAIRKAQREGDDPAGHQCLLCGTLEPVIYRCHAVCESSHVKQTASESDETYGLLRWLFLPAFVNLFLWHRNRQIECVRQGHDVEVALNLPLCDHCATTTGNVRRPAVAKKLMLKIPLYRELLTYYPSLTLNIERNTS